MGDDADDVIEVTTTRGVAAVLGRLQNSADEGELSPRQLKRVVLRLIDSGLASAPQAQIDTFRRGTEGKTMTTTAKATTAGSDPKKLAGTKAGAVMSSARVKSAGESLCSKRYSIKRPDGNALAYGGKSLETPSEFDKAVIGVFVKAMLRKQGVGVELSEWERSLLADATTQTKWVGTTPDGVYHGGGSPDAYVRPERVKSLLDDTVSGGLYITPVQFDDAIITYPLLSGQLSPFVDVRPVTGRRVTTGAMQNLSLTWGTPDGSPVTPFDTSSLVSPLDTAIYPVSGFIELGNDFLADTPVNVGSEVVALYGERLKSELDRVIAVGNGTSEPLGLTNASGMTAVSSDMGSGGPPTVSDYEALVFAVPLQYRLQDLSPAFVCNDTTYSRLSGIKVGPTDQRRVFGTQTSIGGTQQSPMYTAFGYPVRISPSLSNNRILFGGLKKYRLYQRLGAEFVVERGGRTLTLSNKTLIGVRARFGGRPVDGSAFSSMSDAQD